MSWQLAEEMEYYDKMEEEKFQERIKREGYIKKSDLCNDTFCGGSQFDDDDEEEDEEFIIQNPMPASYSFLSPKEVGDFRKFMVNNPCKRNEEETTKDLINPYKHSFLMSLFSKLNWIEDRFNQFVDMRTLADLWCKYSNDKPEAIMDVSKEFVPFVDYWVGHFKKSLINPKKIYWTQDCTDNYKIIYAG